MRLTLPIGDGEREVRVYDYADLSVPMLARMFDRRCQGYEAIGYTIELPGSAVPGWPADAPLPIDPVWKSQYASSVRRLVRDNVDSPLENLFVQVTATPPPNAELPIAFDGRGRMEVDLGGTATHGCAAVLYSTSGLSKVSRRC